MAESDLSRTEPASARRLQQARSEGDVPRSAEFAAWIVLLAALAILGWLAPRLLAALADLTSAAFTHAAEPFSAQLIAAMIAVLWSLLPLMLVVFVAALIAPILLSGWVYAPQRLQADLTRSHPFKPLIRFFSLDALFDGALALFKLLLAAGAIAWAFTQDWPGETGFAGSAQGETMRLAASSWIGQGVIALAIVFILPVALDAGWCWWRYLRRHAMTWQEVVAEAREAELPAEVRAQMQRQQQQASARAAQTASNSPGTRSAGIDEVIG